MRARGAWQGPGLAGQDASAQEPGAQLVDTEEGSAGLRAGASARWRGRGTGRVVGIAAAQATADCLIAGGDLLAGAGRPPPQPSPRGGGRWEPRALAPSR